MEGNMSKDNDGTYAQDKLQAALKAYCQAHKGFYHRFPDTKSAGMFTFLKPQPADYLFVFPGCSLLIECKSTKVGERIVTMAHHGEVGKRQVAKHKLWHRAGHPSLYLLYDYTLERFKFYDGRDVAWKRLALFPIVDGSIAQLEKIMLPEIVRWGATIEKVMSA